MKWEPKTLRCVRRFALFPKRFYVSDKMCHCYVWLEVYYAIQSRYTPSYPWVINTVVDKETWLKWRADHEGVH